MNLKIPQGCIFALLGGNGAGKSTLFKIILGIEKPYSGKIKINGNVAAMPQEVQTLFASRTVQDELSEMSQSSEEIKKAAELTQIENLLKNHPFDLSGGEQQRVAVAKLLLCERDIYFFDEPTKGMDAECFLTGIFPQSTQQINFLTATVFTQLRLTKFQKDLSTAQ